MLYQLTLADPLWIQFDPITTLIIGIGLAVLAAVLFRPKQPRSPIQDFGPTARTTRGAYLNLVKGREQPDPVIAWVGNRVNIPQDVGGGKFGGGGGQQDSWFEDAVHLIAVGPIDKCHGIYWGGKLLDNTTFSRADTPSGSTITTSKGTFRWYWGEDIQPVDPVVSLRYGIDTTFPWICYCVWEPAELGTTPIWQNVIYDVESFPLTLHLDQDLNNSPARADFGSGQTGYNVGWLLWELLTAQYPWGAGQPQSWIEFGTIDAVADQLDAEKVACNLAIRDGETADQVVSRIIADHTIMVHEDNGELCFVAIRELSEPPTIPTLDGNVLSPPLEEYERRQGNAKEHFVVAFEFSDQTIRFKSNSIDIHDDGNALPIAQVKAQSVSLSTVTHKSIAVRIGNRRYLESIVPPAASQIRGARNLRDALPGSPVRITTGPITAIYRVSTLEYSSRDSGAELTVVRDVYSAPELDFEEPDTGPPDASEPATQDAAWFPMELPRKLSPSTISFMMLRARGDATAIGAVIYVSQDALDYEAVGQQSAAFLHGVIDADWSPANPNRLRYEVGPRIAFYQQSYDLDGGSLLNLIGNPAAAQTGLQVMLIEPRVISSGYPEAINVVDGEILYITWFEPTGDVRAGVGPIFIARDIRRARIDSNRLLAVSEDDEFFALNSTRVDAVTAPWFAQGVLSHWKNRPFNSVGGPELDTITAVSKSVIAKSERPLPIKWARSGGRTSGTSLPSRRDNQYRANTNGAVGPFDLDDDLVLEWTIGDPNNGAAAGCMAAGEAHSTNGPFGNFLLTVKANDQIVTTKEIDGTTVGKGTLSWVYTKQAMLDDGVYGLGDGGQGLELVLSYIVGGVQSQLTRVRPKRIAPHG